MFETAGNQLRELQQFEELQRDPVFLSAIERREWQVLRAKPEDQLLHSVYSLDDARMSVRCLAHAKMPKLDLRRDAKQLPLNMLNTNDPWPEIEKLIAGGWSLVVNSEQNSKAALRMLTDALERFSSRRTQLNTYYTPVASRCFKTHVDDHDVVVFQVSGEKYWEIYPFAERTESDQGVHWKLPAEEDRPVFADTVRAGDIIYLPEGYPHRANCGDQPSLHMTFGIRRKSSSWKGLLMDSAGALLQGEPLDTSYVPRVTRPSEETALSDLDRAMQVLREGVARRIREELRSPTPPAFDPTTIRPDELEILAAKLGSEAGLEMLMDSPLELALQESPPRLRTPGSKITLRRATACLLPNIPVGNPFKVADIQGDISQAAASDLCRLLLLNGLVRPAN